MVERPFLSPRMTDVTIPRLRARGLETRLRIDGRSIAFDRNGAVVGPVDVVLVWAAREPAVTSGGGTAVIASEGDLHGRPGELTVRGGDLFMIDGKLAEVKQDARIVKGVAVAPFALVEGAR